MPVAYIGFRPPVYVTSISITTPVVSALTFFYILGLYIHRNSNGPFMPLLDPGGFRRG